MVASAYSAFVAPPEPSFEGEKTTLNGALIGFYVCCTIVGIAAAVSAAAWIVFPAYSWADTAGIVGVVLIAVCSVLSWHFLRVARREY